ncbi:hypothetical protein CK203_031698 [Vitis vinifera]|uniref:DUF4283 domain-containing protein n=1 Tax=Vitis vinifera TaxID=29760 RepID=A0A438I366_VITVI|nr:hypothetical protein CK203_031698 [Vitis vinifera]
MKEGLKVNLEKSELILIGSVNQVMELISLLRLRLEKIQNDFLWGSDGSVNKIHLVRWSTVFGEGQGSKYEEEEGGWWYGEVRDEYEVRLWKFIMKEQNTLLGHISFVASWGKVLTLDQLQKHKWPLVNSIVLKGSRRTLGTGFSEGFSPALLQSVAGEENHKKKKKKIGDQSASVDRINAPKQHLREGVQARHQRVTSHRLEPRHTFRNYAFQYSLGALCCN